MSRLRSFDRQVLEASSSQLLDEDDQTLLIDQLSAQNLESYTVFKRVLSVSLVVQLPVLGYLEHHYHASNAHTRSVQLRFVLMMLSTVLTLVSLRYESSSAVRRTVPDYTNRVPARYVPRIITVVNGAICIRLALVFFNNWTLHKLYYVLPTINLVNLVLFNWWYTQTGDEVAQLRSLRYKFKTV